MMPDDQLSQRCASCSESSAPRDQERERATSREESERHYRHLFEYTTQGVVIQDDAGRILSMNPAAERVLGLSIDDVRLQVLEEAIGQVQNEGGVAIPAYAHPSALARVRMQRVENVVLCVRSQRDRRWRWVLVSAFPLKSDEPGAVHQVFTSFTNINAIKRAEEVSRKREAMWRKIFNSTSDALIIHNSQDASIVDVNDTMPQLYGYERAEALQLSVADLSADRSPHNLALFRERIAGVVEHGPTVFEWSARRKDGEVFPVEVALNASEIGGDVRVLASVRDLTVRKAAEDALRRQSQLEHLVAAVSTRFITTSAERVDGHIERALTEIAALLGAAAAMLVRAPSHRDMPSVTHSWVGSGGLRISRAALHTPRRSVSQDFCVHRAAQRTICPPSSTTDAGDPFEPSHNHWDDLWDAGADVIIEVPMDDKGVERGALCLVFDVHTALWSRDELALLRVLGQVFTSALERQRIQNETDALREQLLQSQKLEAVGRLAGGVAHDFNNILTGIIGYSEMLLEAVELGAHHNDIGEIHRAASRAAKLTAQLLAFSRKQIVKPQTIDLSFVVATASNLIARVIGEDITFVFDPPPFTTAIHADPSQIDQVLVNLATNARDAMPNGGTLTVELALVSFDETSAAAQDGARAGDYVMLVVSDVGEGMGQAVQQRIFEPFFTTKEVGRGTGLGLSTVYGIVHQNKGFITVHSKEGVGTTLRVYFPASSAEVAAQRAAEPAPQPSGSETILLVEDEHIVRQLAQRVLARRGYKVLVAADGEEALRCYADRTPIDLLLTDVVMPGMNGRELHDRLQETHPGLPVLYMSGYAENVIAHHGVLAPGTPFIPKPFSVGALARKVRGVLDQSR